MKNSLRILLLSVLISSAALFSQAQVRNVIFMIGDGMGLPQVSATMIDGDYAPLAIERAQYIGLCKTYSANNRVTDSAAAGTALATGHKTCNGMIGVDRNGDPVKTIIEKAIENDMATGMVVTCYLPHATPAAFSAHQHTRSDLENIASDIIQSNIDVMIGGGMEYFTDRHDGRNLIDELKGKGYAVAIDMEQLMGFESGKIAAIMANGHMPSMLEGRNPEYLPKAVGKALEILAKDSPKGFFLMIEGSQIDFEGHNNNLKGVAAEMRDFDNAIKAAMDFADRNPGTLLVITADHETGGLTVPASKNEGEADFKFSTGGHTGMLVPVYAYGEGAENFRGIMENTELPKIMEKLLGIE